MADFDSSKSGGDAELQEFLMVEKQKAQVNAQVSNRIARLAECLGAAHI